MIYTKKANFPYPILMNFTDDYKDPEFDLDVTLKENTYNYILEYKWKTNSGFIDNLLCTNQARLILIIKSKDNRFFPLPYKKKSSVELSKSQLCVNSRTVIQMMIQANADISFSTNNELNTFYDSMKDDIVVQAGKALGFSGTVIFDGSQKKPWELFEKKVDSKIESDVEIRLTPETIMIVYKNEDLQFSDIQNSRELNYPYIYMGLQKALMAFLIHNATTIEDGIQIDEMEPPSEPLDSKLFLLMQSKNISELSMNNLDAVICQISDQLIPRYNDAIRGIGNGN